LQKSTAAGARKSVPLPGALAARWGLAPGTEVEIRETAEGLLVRPVDPPLTRVYLEPTSECNLRCRTCVRNSWNEPSGYMQMATFRRLIAGLREVPSFQAMHFWGLGEPLLHPCLAEMVALAHDAGGRTEIITNALLLDLPIAESLIQAGLDRLIVSIDGTSVEGLAEVRSGADLRLVQANLKGLQDAKARTARPRPEIGLEFVLMKRNAAELPALPALARSLGAKFVVVTNLLPYDESMSREALYDHWAGSWYPIIRCEGNPEIRLPRLQGRPEVLRPVLQLLEHLEMQPRPLAQAYATSGYCRFVGEGTAAVAWDGGVSPCIPLMHSYPCFVMGRQKEIQRHVVGNVSQEDIATIWRQDDYVKFRSVVRDFDFSPCAHCGGCELSQSNQEDCFGNGFPACGDCLWAKGLIQCP
jgi:MoaA/NifB/PqqE/SkfB family radical SAM enzyme